MNDLPMHQMQILDNLLDFATDLAGAVDERPARSAVRGGDPHQVHVPDELRHLPHGQADLQIPGKKGQTLCTRHVSLLTHTVLLARPPSPKANDLC